MGSLTGPWMEFMRKNTDIPEIFLQSLRYMLLACTLGRYFYLGNTDERIRPNLYLTLASPAGLYYRSHAVDMFHDTLLWCLKTFASEIELDIKNEIMANSIPGGSAEGVADYLEGLQKEGFNSFLTTEHEMGIVLKGMFGHGYESRLIELYIKLFDGKAYHKVFSKKSLKVARFVEKGSYFNLLGVMQDAEHYLTKGMSTTGFVRRMIIAQIRPHKEAVKKRSPLYKEDPIYPEGDFQVFGESIGKEMAEAHKLSKGEINPVFLRSDAREKINKITDKYQMDGRKNPDNPYFLFLGSHGVKVGKLALLEAIDRYGKNAKYVDCEDLRRSHEFLLKLSRNIKTVLELSVLNEDEKKIEKWIWQGKGVIYRYEIKHGKAIDVKTFQQMLCGGYHCRNPYWDRVREALVAQEKDVKFDVSKQTFKYVGGKDELFEHGISL